MADATTELYTYVHTLSLHYALPICNCGRGGVGWREWEIPVRCFGFDDRHNLGWIAAKIGLPDAIVRPHQRNGHTVRGKRSAVVDEIGRASGRERVCQ